MFLTFSNVFPDGATEEDLLRIYRRRPGLPSLHLRTRPARNLSFGQHSRVSK